MGEDDDTLFRETIRALRQAERERDEAREALARVRRHAQDLATQLARYQRTNGSGAGTEHVRHGDPGTSHGAAARQEASPVVTRNKAKHEILRAYAAIVPDGMIAERAWISAGLRARSSPWKRVSDLLAHGYLADTGMVDRTTAGAEARVLRIAERGLLVLSFLEENPAASRYDPRSE